MIDEGKKIEARLTALREGHEQVRKEIRNHEKTLDPLNEKAVERLHIKARQLEAIAVEIAQLSTGSEEFRGQLEAADEILNGVLRRLGETVQEALRPGLEVLIDQVRDALSPFYYSQKTHLDNIAPQVEAVRAYQHLMLMPMHWGQTSVPRLEAEHALQMIDSILKDENPFKFGALVLK